MTADELQAVALRLSMSRWVRHYLRWNYPAQDLPRPRPVPGHPAAGSPWLMAIQCRDASGWPVKVPGLESSGLEWYEGAWAWYAERTNEDGAPYDGSEP